MVDDFLTGRYKKTHKRKGRKMEPMKLGIILYEYFDWSCGEPLGVKKKTEGNGQSRRPLRCMGKNRHVERTSNLRVPQHHPPDMGRTKYLQFEADGSPQ